MFPSANFIPVTSMPGQHHAAGVLLPALWRGLAAVLLLAGCATGVPDLTPGSPAAPVATRWHAPLPHGGQLADLSRWWAQFDDPLLLRLIKAGQEVSPTLAQATARIADARAAGVVQSAALMPALEASIATSRGRPELGMPLGTTSSAGLLLGWELDIFGAGRTAADAAQARLESSQAGWHEARVVVAAEVATAYVELRACEARVGQAESDAQSRARTAQITRLAAHAGFLPPALADLANASAAQGKLTLIRQRLLCDLLIKALTSLTALDETALRRDLANASGLLPRPAEIAISALPAELLAQRPDIYAAARNVIAASADADQAQAQRWPRIALAGNISTARSESMGVSTNGTVWSIGPVSVTLPLFDGGARRANAEAARIRYASATTVYLARLREAIREVEIALVTLDSTAQRSPDAVNASRGFKRAYLATEAGYHAGTASLFELEDARRSLLVAQVAEIELQRERVTAWIALYRALGGGWSATPAPNAAARS